MDRDIDKWKTSSSSGIPQELNKKFAELCSTNKKVIGAHADPP